MYPDPNLTLTWSRIDDVAMNVVVMTNLAREHLEEGERMEDYVSVAASLFSRLEDRDTQRAVINVDGARPWGKSKGSTWQKSR